MKLTIGFCFIWSILTLAPCEQGLAAETQCWIVPNARIAFDFDWITLPWGTPGKRQHANFGHEIEAGKGTVISLRTYRPGENIDFATFSKVTLELAQTLDEIEKSLVLNVTRSYASTGNAAFGDSGAYWRADNPYELQITIFQQASQVHLKVNSDLLMAKVDGTAGPAIKTLAFDCDLQLRNVDELSPWQGKPSREFGSLTPP